MPRRRTRFDYSTLKLNRTVGLEVEGYMKTDPRILINEGGVPHSTIKRDGSLRNYHWQPNCGMYGVEIVTNPLAELAPLKDVFSTITKKGWHASGRAGLHIHVDATDFTLQDKLRFIWFAKQIEDVVFLFVKSRRYNNRYCRMIPQGLANIAVDARFRDAREYGNLISLVSRQAPEYNRDVRMDRYHWLNIFSSSHPTVEFRLFHPIRTADDGGMFAYFVHNLVNTVKSCTTEQLAFIAQSVEQESNIQLKARKLLDAIGVPYDIPIVSETAINSLTAKQARRTTLVSV